MRDWLWLVLSFRLSPLILDINGNFSIGGLCGSVFLDLAFQKYIETMIGETEYNRLKESNRKKMMTDFEYQVKRNFSEHHDIPYSVDLKGVKDDPENDIHDDTIKLKKYASSPREWCSQAS